MIIISNRIGIARALFYHYYYPGLQEFFKQLGMDVILSPTTNKNILDNGVRKAVDDLCLPFKAYYGHVAELMDKVDYLFVPRLISLGKNNCVCPKFMGLPDMIKATFGYNNSSQSDLPNLISPVIDLRKGFFPLRSIAHKVGKKLGVNYWRVEYSFWKAMQKQKQFEQIEKKGYTPEQSMKILQGKIKLHKLKNEKNIINSGKKHNEKSKLQVAVLGHSYLLNDNFLSMSLIDHLKQMSVKVITPEMIEESILEQSASLQSKKLFWYFNRQVMGAAYYFFTNKDVVIDGLIQVTAFGCGPDSLIQELVDIKGKKYQDISILNINLDEHSGQAGLITRLEAFIDLLERRKYA